MNLEKLYGNIIYPFMAGVSAGVATYINTKKSVVEQEQVSKNDDTAQGSPKKRKIGFI